MTDAATRTPAERGRANRRKGADAERAVARYLRTVGFPHAERAEKNGWSTREHTSPDPGDILGTPGIVWSVKNDASNQISKWLDEAEQLRNHHRADLAILVTRRHGKAVPGRWWSWISLHELAHVLTGARVSRLPRATRGHVCMELGDLVAMLRADGHGQRASETT